MTDNEYPDVSLDEIDPYQAVVSFGDYQQMMAEQDRSKDKSPKQAKASKKGEEAKPDEELAARLMSRVEFDTEKAIERVRNKKWLIYGVIPHGAVGYIYGKPGSYKSFMAVDMASHVAAAMHWNGIDVDLPGMVLYVAGEGASQLHVRKKAWAIKSKGDNSAMHILEVGVAINSATERRELMALMREIERMTGNKFVMVVLDTFSKCFIGDENDAAEMRNFIKGCEEIRDSFDGCTVLFVGHTGKADTTSMRGSSVALADAEFSYLIRRGSKKLYAEIHCDKIKDATEPDDMAFNLHVVDTGYLDQKGLKMCSLVPTMTAILDREEETGEKPGRAEVMGGRVPDGNKSRLERMVRFRQRQNGGEPVPRLMIREDFLTELKAEGLTESGAKSAWNRAWYACMDAKTVVLCEGDQWKIGE